MTAYPSGGDRYEGSSGEATAMRYSQLTGEQILQSLSECYNVVAAITKYQGFLAGGAGLPKR